MNFKDIELRTWILLIIFIIFSILFINQRYAERGWVKDDPKCGSWVAYSYDDLKGGFQCLLTNCTEIKTELNAIAEECICEWNDKKVIRYCDRIKQDKIYTKGYKSNVEDLEKIREELNFTNE